MQTHALHHILRTHQLQARTVQVAWRFVGDVQMSRRFPLLFRMMQRLEHRTNRKWLECPDFLVCTDVLPAPAVHKFLSVCDQVMRRHMYTYNTLSQHTNMPL
jgi:hypothetical protein